MKNLYFCHIPKTGGTYIENILLNKKVKSRFLEKNIQVHYLGHGSGGDISFLPYRQSNNILLSCIRNPIDLILSLYSHGQAGFSDVLEKYNISNFFQFYDLYMANNITEYSAWYCDDIFLKCLFDEHNQTYFDYLLRTEDLESELKRLLKEFDIYFDDVEFNLSNYDKNNFVYEEFEASSGMFGSHKKERLSGDLITEKNKDEIYEKYKRYCDLFGYIK